MKFFNSYSLNFAKLVGGTAGAQVISFITLPILTRMYSVGDFGVQALYMSIASILVIVVTGRYELAILLPKDDEDSFALVILVLVIAALGCVGIEIVSFIGSQWLAEILQSKDISSWLLFLSFTIFVQVNYNVWYTWLNRNRAYNMMSRMAIISSICNFLAAFAYGYYTNADGHGLLLNTFAGLLICTLYMLYYCRKKDILPLTSISIKRVMGMMRRYKRFPRYLVFGHILNVGSTQLPVFILQGIGGQALVGLFSMVQKILQIPISLIGSAMGNVFIREASESWQKAKNCWPIYHRTMKLLLLLGIIPFTVLFIGASDLLPLFLGEKWRDAGIYIAYLCPMFYMSFVSSPLSSMFTITEKLKMDLCVQIVRCVLVYTSMMGAFYLVGTSDGVLIGYGAAFTIFYIWNMMLTMKWAKGESYF